MEFRPLEILRTADAYSGCPDTRRLSQDRHDIGRTFVSSMISPNVMNDVGLCVNSLLPVQSNDELGMRTNITGGCTCYFRNTRPT